ncbi:DEAD/DEAH box helicase [Escherichia coli]|uniref:DEAD/DEAH box helicase n=1 Tax=Escherichia coli TaxID=562 RepID=UPI0010AB7AB1|nr:DEAD/DEAH box helicase [Escherichia coli]ELP2895884.1 DEAD/DEAH box helicase [Escherichia coli O128]EET0018180.1 DEAD/DEAH box helicase [Escherichia coli]EET0019279.1 DEAD/DEAH box helicase [Escherichia coli]EET5525967.1 DEAD/DEAH box helicase [Escherichia coli]EEU0347626.1 DEAD/DEAH box helicase [Escherichia coli]
MLKITPNFAQERGLNQLRQQWKQHRTYLMYAPTGSGKTGLAAFVTAGMVERGMRVMFVCPYTILLNQTAERFTEYGLPWEEISFVWRDHPNHDPERLIQIASADTLIRREFPDNIDLLIVDEAHMKRRALLEVIRDKDIRVLGLSGTPFAAWMGKYYECLIKPTTIRELIQRGDLSDYEFFAPSMPDLAGVKTSNTVFGRDYNEEQLASIMGSSDLVGDIVRNWLENGEDLPTICFCVNVAHANFVTREFLQAGIGAEVMTADTPHDERQDIIRRFEEGATKIIVNVGVLVAGFDSDVRCLIYARPTKSEIRWLQCIGRALRTASGKKRALIFDHSGTVHRLGFPEDIEYDELPGKNDGMKASAGGSEVKAEKLPRECPKCHFMKPAGVHMCPKCGFRPLGGDDVATDRDRKLSRVNKGKREYSREEKQRWWSEIKGYQNYRNATGKPLSDGWCAHTYKEKFGVWPKGFSNAPLQPSVEVCNFIRSKNIAYARGRKKAMTGGQHAN